MLHSFLIVILSSLFQYFSSPDNASRPYVRWWWNGDKVEKNELIRELNLLHEAGIGGVEINPIAYPGTTDELNVRALDYLSDEWIDMLKAVFGEADRLEMTCDLIIGSGWPFGAEYLPREDRASVMLTYAEKLKGGTHYESSKYNLLCQSDPGVTIVNPRRSARVVSILLAPDPISDISEVRDLTQVFDNEEFVSIDVPEQGDWCLYVMSRFDSFASVIHGAPGASGSILNHMDREAVLRYLNHMADEIESRIGPLSRYLRSFFVDSMELEGCNWTKDFAEEFERRRGYDIMPWLPLIMFKVGRLGEVTDYRFGADKTEQFQEELNRVRFDFELTKAELLHERYTETFLAWCREKGVKSRAQAYGRGFFPLESSLGYDIPEGESWTTNWLRHRLGEEMGDEDYRRGRGYTMINKYVSSAANLAGRRIVSSEEMTNTYKVFYTSQEFLKIGSDMGAFSGTTHSVWSGFNYSPPEARFPGWVRYGSFTNEKNPCWFNFRALNDYRARISAVLQRVDMYTDIAILPANYDMWAEMGVQTDPFPWKLNVPYTSLLWEAIHKCGGGADYISDRVLAQSFVRDGCLCYGNRRYKVIILPEVKSMSKEAMERLLEFVSKGGRVFCIGCKPCKSLGYKDFEARDREMLDLLARLEKYTDRFVLLEKPDDGRYLEWYQDVMAEYRLPHRIDVSNPDRFLLINNYTADNGDAVVLLVNASLNDSKNTRLAFGRGMYAGKTCFLYDPESGKRYKLACKAGTVDITLGPAESYLLVFEKDDPGEPWQPLPLSGPRCISPKQWTLTAEHTQKGMVMLDTLDALCDLQKMDRYRDFMGHVTYKTTIELGDKAPSYINLGKVCEICSLKVNGVDCGTKWFGNRIYDISGLLHPGVNELEIRVSTLTGNYVRTLKDNIYAQRFILKKGHDFAPMGLLGPVTLYE